MRVVALGGVGMRFLRESSRCVREPQFLWDKAFYVVAVCGGQPVVFGGRGPGFLSGHETAGLTGSGLRGVGPRELEFKTS